MIVGWMADTLGRAGSRRTARRTPARRSDVCQAASAYGSRSGGRAIHADRRAPHAPRARRCSRRRGLEARPDYGGIEMGQVGEVCVAPAGADDLHLMEDMHAVIQPGAEGPARGLPRSPPPVLAAPDRPSPLPQRLTRRRRDGGRGGGAAARWRPTAGRAHLSDVRSFEKLTSAGMTFLDVDVIRILDETLPGRLGGVPGQYQLVEEERPDGRPRVRLLVHPAVGPLDPASGAGDLPGRPGVGLGGDGSMVATWREAGLVEVERRPTMTETIGKILHLRTSGRR